MVGSFGFLRGKVAGRDDLRYRLVKRILAGLDSLCHFQIEWPGEIPEEFNEFERVVTLARLSALRLEEEDDFRGLRSRREAFGQRPQDVRWDRSASISLVPMT